MEACVFGIPDERLGDVRAAVIFRRENAKIGASELKAFLREHLAGFKIPERILFSKDSLPQTATGKIDRRGLRQRQRYRDLIDTSIKGA